MRCNLRPVEALTTADLLIVDAAEPGTVAERLLRSVRETASRRSARPIIVVRGRLHRPLRVIVVGTDGSSAAAAALDWAAGEAEHDDAAIVVVHAWNALDPHGRRDLARAQAQCIIDASVHQVQEKATCDVRGELIEGDAAAVLLAASADADIVAVGSRGRSGFKTLLFGSVALSLAEQATCSVAIIHPKLRH